jgi:hypothetical protein
MEKRLLGRGQSPASLKVGTRVGPWRVVAWRGQGSYGLRIETPWSIEAAARPPNPPPRLAGAT